MRVGFFEALFIKWRTRALGTEVDRLIFLLPILICIGSENSEQCLKNARKIVFAQIRSKYLANLVFKRILMKVKKYLKNEEAFKENRQKAYEIIVQNIQMFGIVLDVLEGVDLELARITMIVKKAYEEEFSLPVETKRLLEYQERRYFNDHNVIK
ncbi:hypothetical protein [Helicobacter enhydrae]|nr:hypothetical protein [Helicobacter enhydrae]